VRGRVVVGVGSLAWAGAWQAGLAWLWQVWHVSTLPHRRDRL